MSARRAEIAAVGHQFDVGAIASRRSLSGRTRTLATEGTDVHFSANAASCDGDALSRRPARSAAAKSGFQPAADTRARGSLQSRMAISLPSAEISKRRLMASS